MKVDKHLLLVPKNGGKLVGNKSTKIFAGKDIIPTFKLPSERKSRPSQKSERYI